MELWTLDFGLSFELRDDRRVIRWSLPTARFFVDPSFGATLGERRRDPDVIDAKTGVAAKTGRAIVPPRILTARRDVLAERINEAPSFNFGECALFRFAKKYAPAPELRVVHVAVFRCDVEVAAQQHLVVCPMMLVEELAQSPQPREFELILLRPDRLPVRHIDVDHTHAADCAREQTRVRRLFPVAEAALHIRHGQTRDDGHAVVSRLAEHDRPIT